MTQRKRHTVQSLRGAQMQSFWSFSCNMLILPGYHVWQYTHSVISQGNTFINLWYPEFLWRLNYTLSRLLTVSLQPLSDVRLTCLVSSFFRGWNSCCAQFSCSVCLSLCNPMDCSTPGFPIHHQLLELVQTHVFQVGDDIQSPHPLWPLLLLPSVFPSHQGLS